MKTTPAKLFSFLLLLAITVGCKNEKKVSPYDDTPTSGTIYISADESFRPVIEQQIALYESSYPGTRIIASYKSEVDCFRDFFRDSSTRLIIVTRGLTNKEDRYMRDSLTYAPAWSAIASDAVAVLVNSASSDSVFSLEMLRDQLEGKINRNKKMVFDGLNATSTVRFVKDSILKGGSFDTAVVKAARNSREVIDYVAGDTNAIGLVGISWIGNPEDSAQVAMLNKVKIAYVRCEVCGDTPFVKPMQQSVVTRRYPLVRGLYYIMKENHKGLGTGFTSFLKYERGQLIFKRAYLGTVMDFRERKIRLNEKLPKN